jgi:hypothetical protein
VVEAVLQSTGSVPLTPGKFVLTINKKSPEALVAALSELTPGSPVSLDITSPDPRWREVDCALGALYRLLTGGSINSGLENTAAPRTAVGVKADGTTVFYIIDGRQSGHSVGATMPQVAQRLQELGCVDAVCLDGGGSTTLLATAPDSGGPALVNSPSDGSQRAVSNALFLTSTLAPSGVPGSLYLTAKSRVLLPGGQTAIGVALVDTNGYPMTGNPALTFSAQRGTIDSNGLYTAPSGGGSDTISATSPEGLTGSATVTVFAAPDAISVQNETTGKGVTSLTLAAREQVELSASAKYRTLALTAADWNFTWSVSPAGLGTVTESGLFTAGGENGTGTLSVSAGGFAATIPVTVADTQAPSVSLTVSGEGNVFAAISDNSGLDFGAENCGLFLDGQPAPFAVTDNTLTAAFVPDGAMHRVSVTARDAGGNIGRAAQTIGAAPETPFADMAGHWAESYTSYLNQRGIITGIESDKGLQFAPNLSVTRGEFALMTARWLGLHQEDFEDTETPFADSGELPSWSANAVKALYAKGIMQGSQVGHLLYANANAPISRAEAITLLGRMQESGYPRGDLRAFPDADTVPAWAKPHVESLVAQGVVNGSDGLLKPAANLGRAELAKILVSLW